MDSRRKIFPVIGRAKTISARPRWAGVAYTSTGEPCASWKNIAKVQFALRAMGLYHGEVDAVWDVDSQAALNASGFTFQRLAGGCTLPLPGVTGQIGRAAADWPGYPEPIPPTCWNNPAFQDEYWEKNNKLWDEAGVEAEKTLKDDPNSTCGVRSGSTAIKPSVRDCQQMLYEPRHDKMARDLMAKYDCLEGGSGAASESGSSGGGGSSGSGSSSTNFMLWGLGAAAVIGGAGWYFLRGPGKKYMGNPVGMDDFDGDQHNLFNTLVLSAVNDGDAYRDNRNAEKAVKTAWKELRRIRDEALKEDYDVVRKVAVREVAHRWASW